VFLFTKNQFLIPDSTQYIILANFSFHHNLRLCKHFVFIFIFYYQEIRMMVVI